MYRLNRLPRNVLIVTDEVIAQGPTDANPDPRNLLSAIQIAEERFIRPLLGRPLYDDFRNRKNTLVTSANNSALTTIINEGISGTQLVLNDGDIINAIEFVENEHYVDLWNEHLWKLIAECVVYIASPTNFSRHTAAGEMVNNPKSISNEGSGANSVDLPDMKWKLEQMLQNRIDPLVASLKEYMCEQRGYFPLYRGECGRNERNGISVDRKTAWVNVYKRDKRRESYDSAMDWNRD